MRHRAGGQYAVGQFHAAAGSSQVYYRRGQTGDSLVRADAGAVEPGRAVQTGRGGTDLRAGQRYSDRDSAGQKANRSTGRAD